MAARSSAIYRKDGKEIQIPSENLFRDIHTLMFDNVGAIEAYPNRNSLIYIDRYRLKGVRTMFRGTLRYPGWSQLMTRIVDLGLLEVDERPIPSPRRPLGRSGHRRHASS